MAPATEPMHAWLSIAKVVEAEGDHVELTLTVGSFKDPLVINIDAGSWSRMLSNPTEPYQAFVRFEPRD